MEKALASEKATLAREKADAALQARRLKEADAALQARKLKEADAPEGGDSQPPRRKCRSIWDGDCEPQPPKASRPAKAEGGDNQPPKPAKVARTPQAYAGAGYKPARDAAAAKAAPSGKGG